MVNQMFSILKGSTRNSFKDQLLKTKAHDPDLETSGGQKHMHYCVIEQDIFSRSIFTADLKEPTPKITKVLSPKIAKVLLRQRYSNC